jgi:hypothetical protein
MKHIIPLIAAAVFLFYSGCSSKQQQTNPGNKSETGQTEGRPDSSTAEAAWFYFSAAGIHSVQSPKDIPAVTFVPWTEAVRVSDSAIVNKVPSFLINRLGLMTSGSGTEPPALHTDPDFFSSATAAAIYNTGSETGIRMYRNTFFPDADGKQAADQTANGLFMATFDSTNGHFSALMTAKDLGLNEKAQCVALDRIGSMWYAAFKYESDSKVQFSYIEFESFPAKDPSTGNYTLSGQRQITRDSYQKSVAPFSFADAPDSLKSVLATLPAGTAVNLRLYSPSFKSAQNYTRPGDGTPVDATAFVSDDRTAVLFADGTFYYRSDNQIDKTSVIRLPPLANGYVYTNFILTDKSLLAAWEERRFYETGRAGLLEISLPDAVY